jgi:hypothetical protein
MGVDMGAVALRASMASHAGEPLKVSPDEYMALQNLCGDGWDDTPIAVRQLWKAVLGSYPNHDWPPGGWHMGHPVIDGVDPSLFGLPVIVE